MHQGPENQAPWGMNIRFEGEDSSHMAIHTIFIGEAFYCQPILLNLNKPTCVMHATVKHLSSHEGHHDNELLYFQIQGSQHLLLVKVSVKRHLSKICRGTIKC